MSHRRYEMASICPCGFRVLRDEIPIGKLYEVREDSVRGGWSFQCGGCGAVHSDIKVILARDDSGRFHPLPLVIFGDALLAAQTEATP